MAQCSGRCGSKCREASRFGRALKRAVFKLMHQMRIEPIPALQTIVIVEGVSDRVALETLAARRTRDLAAEGVTIEVIGGAHAIGPFLSRLNHGRQTVRLAGLVDAGEASRFSRALERAGMGTKLGIAEMEQIGFYVCDADLEDELIRAIGPEGMESVIEELGEMHSYRRFQKQPAQRGRPIEAHLHRFIGTHSGRKALYARALVDALADDRVPPPLDRLLAYI